jgi:hypothetical protein
MRFNQASPTRLRPSAGGRLPLRTQTLPSFVRATMRKWLSWVLGAAIGAVGLAATVDAVLSGASSPRRAWRTDSSSPRPKIALTVASGWIR